MIRGSIGKLLVAVVLLALTTTAATANASPSGFRAKLTGFQEVPPKLTGGSGTLKATISNGSIAYTLTYSGLTAPAVAAHLHFGERGVNGGIFAFLCGGGGKPACPAGTTSAGTVSGTITAADILAVSDQGITAGDFAGALRIIQAGVAYGNVHTPTFPAGEIRGQVRATHHGDAD